MRTYFSSNAKCKTKEHIPWLASLWRAWFHTFNMFTKNSILSDQLYDFRWCLTTLCDSLYPVKKNSPFTFTGRTEISWWMIDILFLVFQYCMQYAVHYQWFLVTCPGGTEKLGVLRLVVKHQSVELAAFNVKTISVYSFRDTDKWG